MAYSKTDRCAKKLRNMRNKKLQLKEERASKFPMEARIIFPDIRRQVFVFDWDFGEVTYQFNLHKTRRIDCYDITDGEKTIYNMMGWHRFLGELGKAFPRVQSYD